MKRRMLVVIVLAVILAVSIPVASQAVGDSVGLGIAVGATFPQVSHCYQRPAYPPDWPYTLFTMVHGQEREETAEIVRHIHQAIGPAEHTILYSLKEYKKERVRYFED